MGYDIDYLESQLPYYLLGDRARGFLEELKGFLEGRKVRYFSVSDEHQWLQGDGATSLPVVDVARMERSGVTGIVLSNTCDISPDNRRDLPPKVTFAPLISLPAYESALRSAGIDDGRIQAKLEDIRAQRVTNMLFLPQDGQLEVESIALLDDLHSIPNAIMPDCNEKRLFSLSQIGHYLFLFKLSVHFCRFHEGLERG